MFSVNLNIMNHHFASSRLSVETPGNVFMGTENVCVKFQQTFKKQC